MVSFGEASPSNQRGAAAGGADGIACTYVAVLTKCPNVMPPRDPLPNGSLACDLRLAHMQSAGRSMHRDWTKAGGCTVHASSTHGAGENGGGSGARWLSTGPSFTPSMPRASCVVDGVEDTYWQSASLSDGGGSHSQLESRLTIDLGSERWVDRLVVLWGGEEAASAKGGGFLKRSETSLAPRSAEMILAPEAAVTIKAMDAAAEAEEAAAAAAAESGGRGRSTSIWDTFAAAAAFSTAEASAAEERLEVGDGVSSLPLYRSERVG